MRSTAPPPVGPFPPEPPRDLEAERAILGGALYPDNPAALDAIRAVPRTYFSADKNRDVRDAMIAVYDQHGAVDLGSVTHVLRQRGQLDALGGAAYLDVLFEEAALATTTPAYVQRLREAGEARETLAGAGELAAAVRDGATPDSLRAMRQSLAQIGEETPSGPVVVTRRLSDFAREEVVYVWDRRLARGKLTLIAGDPGVGKSYLTADLMARVTAGAAWPDGGVAPRGDVVLLAAEDDEGDTIRPRVEDLGGDPARVHVLTAVRVGRTTRQFSLASDLAALETTIRQTIARLVVVDPINNYIGGKIDTHKDSEVRAALMPLAEMAKRTGAAIAALIHFNKGGGQKALYPVVGSIAYVGVARLVLVVAVDPDTPGRRFMASSKSNLAATAPTLAFSISDAGLIWEPGPVAGVDADALLGTPAEDREERRDATDLLRDLLRDGEVPAAEVFRAASDNAISKPTMYRAKRRLGVKARKEGQPGARGGRWLWSLPIDDPPKVITQPPKVIIPENVITFGETATEIVESVTTSPKVITDGEMITFDDHLRAEEEETGVWTG